MRLAPAHCIDHQGEHLHGYSVPTLRLSLPVGVDSPPDYLLSENKRYGILSSSMSQFRTAHPFISPILGKPLLRVGLFVFTMVQASIRFLARGAS
jgi:hypothetical protein